MSDAGSPDAATLVGLLADEDRRKVVAALVLGAASAADVARVTALDAPRTWKAVGRLVEGGLVEQSADGTLVLMAGEFGRAARAAATARSDQPVDIDVPPDVARVLRSFVRDGRLLSIPATRSKRLIVLDHLAQKFEPGQRYPERAVNAILARSHPDPAALRRFLVDEGFLDREGGEYWRSGGTFEPDRG